MGEKTNWFMLTHLSALLGCVFPFGNFIGPVAIWFLKQDEIPEVVPYAKAALNFQITISIIGFLLFWIPLLGWVIAGLIFLFAIIQVVLASLKASNGQFYVFPFSFKFLK